MDVRLPVQYRFHIHPEPLSHQHRPTDERRLSPLWLLKTRRLCIAAFMALAAFDINCRVFDGPLSGPDGVSS